MRGGAASAYHLRGIKELRIDLPTYWSDCGSRSDNNEVWGWGWNGFGELGMGEAKVKLLVSRRVTTVTAVTESHSICP